MLSPHLLRAATRSLPLVALLTACGGPPSAADAGREVDAGGGVRDAATGPGELRAMTVSAYAVCEGAAPLAECGTTVQVTVFGPALARVPDATVTVNGVEVPSVGDGLYSESSVGFAPSYTFVATRGGDELSATHASPADFSFSLTPDPPIAGEAVRVTWDTTTADGSVVVEVNVGTATHVGPEADDGEVDLPADAFPTPGSLPVAVGRTAFTTGPASGDASTLTLVRREVFVAE